MITTTFTALRKAHACTEGYRKLAEYLGSVGGYGANTPIPVSVILDSNGLDDALWVLRNAVLEDMQSLMVTWACDCAERALPVWEAKYPEDRRPHDAIAAARNWVANPCKETWQAAYAVCAASDAAWAADAAADATDASAYAAARAARVAEREWQINRLKELLG